VRPQSLEDARLWHGLLCTIDCRVRYAADDLRPQDNGTSSTLNIELPPGVNLAETAAVSAQATAILRRQPEVTDVVESIGEDGSVSSEVRNACSTYPLCRARSASSRSVSLKRKLITELRRVPTRASTSAITAPVAAAGRDITLYLTGDERRLGAEHGASDH